MKPQSTHTSPKVDPDAFKEALSALPAGVVIVTAWLDGRAWGMTVSACCSISVTPPRVLVSLHRRTMTRTLVCDQRRFGVSVLGSEHKGVAELAARPGSPKFLDDYCDGDRESELGPRIRGALCHLDCAVDTTVEVSDHTLVIGGVESVAVETGSEPLVYFGRAYRRVGSQV